MRRRQLKLAIPYFSFGRAASEQEELRRLLAELAREIDERATQVRDAASSFSNVPPYNKRFSGRLEELLSLRERMKDQRSGVVVGLHGLGGIGKTELAFTYAHAFASDYKGGRFYVPCEGQGGLQEAMLAIGQVPEIRARIRDNERRSVETYFAAIKRVLVERIEALGHVLLVLDNVEREQLLRASETDALTTLGPGLHVLATTRLAPFPGADWLTLGELDEPDALTLVEKHRPLTDPAECEAARRLVQRLGGFTLAVELAAAYLGAHPTVKLRDFVEARLGADLEGLDSAAKDSLVELRRHNNEKRFESVLAPTLDALTQVELRALEYAAFLAPDRVPLAWLRELVGADAKLALAPRSSGFPDPWDEACRRLTGLALLSRIELGDPRELAGDYTSFARVHRLIQSLVHRRLASRDKAERRRALARFVEERIDLDETGERPLHRWELDSLESLAITWDTDRYERAAWLLRHVGTRLHQHAELARAEALLRRALALAGERLGLQHAEVANAQNDLALLLTENNKPSEAVALCRSALEIVERRFGPDHVGAAGIRVNLALAHSELGNWTEAKSHLRVALAIKEAAFGPDHAKLAGTLNNLGNLLRVTNEVDEAEVMLRRALSLAELYSGADDELVATICCRLSKPA